MGCSRRVCAGLIVGTITLALLAVAFIVPWYYVSTTATIGDDCSIQTMLSWEGLFCESNGCNNQFDVDPCFFVDEEDRSINGTALDSRGVKEVFHVTGAMLGIALASTGTKIELLFFFLKR